MVHSPANDPAGALTEAILANPGDASLYLRLAELHEAEGRPREALDVYLRLLQAEPGARTYLMLAARLPRRAWPYAFHWLNARWQLRSCTRVGRWPRVRGRLFLEHRGDIVIGDRVQFLSHYARSVLYVPPGGRLEVGDRTVINYGADIAATKLVHIGADCLIGTHAIILDNDFHDVADRSRRPEGRPVIIGDRVWLGNRSTILPGVTIGDDAVVGAGSVVLTDVAPNTVVMGNPARPVKRL